MCIDNWYLGLHQYTYLYDSKMYAKYVLNFCSLLFEVSLKDSYAYLFFGMQQLLLTLDTSGFILSLFEFLHK